MKIAVKSLLLFFTILIVTLSCEHQVDQPHTLPYLGFKEIEKVERDGVMIEDTIYHTIGNFYFTAHTGEAITNETVKNRIYVADFFFTNCPSICPIMTQNLKKFHERTKDIDELLIISHTIDPERDSLERLNAYISLLNIDPRDNWFFVRGSQNYTYDIGKDEYLINADVDREAEGGFLHSEHFVLVDREGHIRGMYEGTDTTEVNRLEKDLRHLISEEYDK